MIEYHKAVLQRTQEWIDLRCGILTASEMKLILTPKNLAVANNDNSRAHVWEIASQRLSKYTEPSFQSYAMARGAEDEVEARILYNANYAPVEDCGFVTNDEFGFTLGYSPDGLIGDDGLIEAKSRCQYLQMKAIVENIALDTMPEEHVLQVQTGLLVTKRKWCDYITYCGGFDMATVRIFPDLEIQAAIINASTLFEEKVREKMALYVAVKKSDKRILPTERRVEEEMVA